MAQILWFCEAHGCEWFGPEQIQYETRSIGESPVCGRCGKNLTWRTP